MIKFLDDPLYYIALHPSDLFFKNISSFFKKNQITDNILKSDFKFNYVLKAPFYLSNLNTENELIDKFKNINLKEYQCILKYNFDINSLEKINNIQILKLNVNKELNYFSSMIIREFDIFRRTLNSDEIKIDLLRFNQLSEKELIYYHIWGYPYYFEFSYQGIPISYENIILKYNLDFKTVFFSSVKLLRQENIKSWNYKELADIF